MTVVYTASVCYSIWEGSMLNSIHHTLAGAQKACDEKNGEPLDWSDPTIGIFDPSDDTWNAEGDGVYTVQRVLVAE